jgi:hypothetical protein
MKISLRPWLHRRDLTKLAQIFGSDKAQGHSYTEHYERYFERLRSESITLLEIGVGGWGSPTKGGASLRMWQAYFRRGKIYGIDIEEKQLPGLKIFRGSQDDEEFLTSVIDQIGAPDIIIDDGSHYTHHVIKSFKVLFPLLKAGGIYAIEDLQSSYWPSTVNEDWNGSSDPNASHTSMTFLKNLVDGVNHAERPAYQPSYFDRNIRSISFFHNLAFIEKGVNDEPSNVIVK